MVSQRCSLSGRLCKIFPALPEPLAAGVAAPLRPPGLPRPDEPGLVTVPSKRGQDDELRSAEDVANAQPGERAAGEREPSLLIREPAKRALRPNA